MKFADIEMLAYSQVFKDVFVEMEPLPSVIHQLQGVIGVSFKVSIVYEV